MKNIRICLLASIGVLLGYLGGVFIFAGFDITQWATVDRAITAVGMPTAGVLGAGVGSFET